jgi:hypothetical protein
MTDRNYWHKQQSNKALFSELAWSRPENKRYAGKLLIIGGNAHGFAAAAEAYNESEKARIGVARVLLPDALQKTVGPVLEAGEFATSTPSGSFSQRALGEFLAISQWADGVVLAGDLGRNSETAILLESFIHKYEGPLAITKDAIDYFTKTPAGLLSRPDTTLILSLAQLQQLARGAQFPTAITFDMDLLHLVDALHDFTTQFHIHIVVKHLHNMFVAVNGQVSTTTLTEDVEIWRVATAARACVWWLQQLSKPFEALTTSIVVD